MLLYYITDRKAFPGGDREQRTAVLRRISEAAAAGVNYIQLREKELCVRDLERLACEALQAVRESSSTTRLLINGRPDVALACGADGVHLPSGDISASTVRTLWMKCCGRPPLIGVSAHSFDEVRQAEAHGANFAVLAPIFEKQPSVANGMGLDALRDACSRLAAPDNVEAGPSARFAVLALGGVNLTNAAPCLKAGASGVAGIRLFQTGDVREAVRCLRALGTSFE